MTNESTIPVTPELLEALEADIAACPAGIARTLLESVRDAQFWEIAFAVGRVKMASRTREVRDALMLAAEGALAYKVDSECPAEEFWSSAPEWLRAAGAGPFILNDAQLAELKSLPGWSSPTAPTYAPHPLCEV
jgi:hypothetical protein